MIRRLIVTAGIMALASCESSPDAAGIGQAPIVSPSAVVEMSPSPSPPASPTPSQGALDQLARAAMALLQANDAGTANSVLNTAADRSGCDLTWQNGWLRSMKGAATVEAVAERYLELGADAATFVIERPSEILAATYPFGPMPGSARYALVLGMVC